MKYEQPDGKVNAAANTPDHYWYRQGKDDGVQMERERIVFWLRNEGIETAAWRAAVFHLANAIERGDHLYD